MSDGIRDAFVENDVIGNYAVGTSPLGGMAYKRSRKTRKRRKAKMPKMHRKHRVRHRKRRTRRTNKPKFGTKAWMTYIRSLRKKRL